MKAQLSKTGFVTIRHGSVALVRSYLPPHRAMEVLHKLEARLHGLGVFGNSPECWQARRRIAEAALREALK